MSDAFAHLNLRYNPFGELDPDERSALVVGDLQGLASLVVPGVAVQLRGACGRGKTSHLLGLAALIPDAHYVRADQDPRVCEGVVLLDEADLVGPWRRARLLRRARAVVVGTHRDLSTFLRLRGDRVVDIDVARSDPDHVLRIATRRIEAARLAEGPVPTVEADAARVLAERFGSDQRAIEGVLYAAVQRMTEVGPVPV